MDIKRGESRGRCSNNTSSDPIPCRTCRRVFAGGYCDRAVPHRRCDATNRGQPTDDPLANDFCQLDYLRQLGRRCSHCSSSNCSRRASDSHLWTHCYVRSGWSLCPFIGRVGECISHCRWPVSLDFYSSSQTSETGDGIFLSPECRAFLY
jgi:hypothetical protein